MADSDPAVIIPINPIPLSSGLALVSSFFIFLGLGWIVFLARLWTRLRIISTAGLDDLFMGVALVRSLCMRPTERIR